VGTVFTTIVFPASPELDAMVVDGTLVVTGGGVVDEATGRVVDGETAVVVVTGIVVDTDGGTVVVVAPI
jgi:heptaprenylglyceryl phosphate synthase